MAMKEGKPANPNASSSESEERASYIMLISSVMGEMVFVFSERRRLFLVKKEAEVR